jgi:hypothetical protein
MSSRWSAYEGRRTPSGNIVRTPDGCELSSYRQHRDWCAEFDWGPGSGPGGKQLAFAILCDRIGPAFADAHWRDYLFQVVEVLPSDWYIDPFSIDCFAARYGCQPRQRGASIV